MPERIYLSPPHLSGLEIEYIKDAFELNWISSTGFNIQAFEEELCEYIGVGYTGVVSSGTAAIHLALTILGVELGDEVICSTFTFAGAVFPVIYKGATPVFIDSERESWNMDHNILKKAIQDRLRAGKKPKAIIVVHLYGMPAQLDQILGIANEYDIPVIEDAAEALGSEYHGKKLGGFGDIGIISFNGNKIITTSGGGALVSDNSEYVDKAKFLATQARDPFPHYEHSEIGFNYRMSNVSAGIGRGQMKILDHHITKRRANFELYKDKLKDFGLKFLIEPPEFFSNRWLTCAVIKDSLKRDSIMHDLEDQNIESRPLWKPMHLQPVFKDCQYFGNGVSDELFEKGLCLPSGSSLRPEDFERIISTIKKSLA